jgi:hypothetical protein
LRIVDESHVGQAACRIAAGISSGSAMEKITNTFGGVLAGAGIASIYSIMFGNGEHEPAEIIAAIILTALSAILLTVNLMLTFARRRAG